MGQSLAKIKPEINDGEWIPEYTHHLPISITSIITLRLPEQYRVLRKELPQFRGQWAGPVWGTACAESMQEACSHLACFGLLHIVSYRAKAP